jgi:hypothetical protein
VQQSNDSGISFNKGNFTFSPNMKKNSTTSLACAEIKWNRTFAWLKSFVVSVIKEPLSVDLFENQQPK